ncbi:MAG TPA: inositol monophosphatase [Planctomycetes bacterium]|nr:inositol monophosphatase [Planctomycetota bacterium]
MVQIWFARWSTLLFTSILSGIAVLPVPVEIPSTGDIEAVIELIEGAGQILLEYQGKILHVERKGFRDLVTEADRASEKHILAGLSRLFPADSILAEESGDVASGGERCWMVDPLDGTTNYSHRHPFFSVSVGLIDAEGPLAAVTHAPVLGETWSAIRAGGCWHRDVRTGTRQPLTINSSEDLGVSLLATGFSYERRELDHGALDVFESLLRRAREIRRGGSACLDLAHTASGVFQGFWEFYLAPHDVAAGALLVREAGGIVTDSRGGDDWLTGGSIVASSVSLHPILLEEVSRATPPARETGEVGD